MPSAATNTARVCEYNPQAINHFNVVSAIINAFSLSLIAEGGDCFCPHHDALRIRVQIESEREQAARLAAPGAKEVWAPLSVSLSILERAAASVRAGWGVAGQGEKEAAPLVERRGLSGGPEMDHEGREDRVEGRQGSRPLPSGPILRLRESGGTEVRSGRDREIAEERCHKEALPGEARHISKAFLVPKGDKFRS